MKIQVTVTKEHYRKAMWCGTEKMKGQLVTQNCAIALAIVDILPGANVETTEIYVYSGPKYVGRISLPMEASDMIYDFDDLSCSPQERLNLPETTFEIDLPKEVVDSIGIKEVEKILEKSSNLELVK